MDVLKAVVSRKWLIPTILVLLGSIFLVRLGLWQLDRLEQRRTFNAQVAERWRVEPLNLSEQALPAELDELEFRRVSAEGVYDYGNQIVLSNQTRGNSAGVVLVTPLVMDDGSAILVARGWVPYAESAPETVAQFDEIADGPVVGLLQESQLLPGGRPISVPDAPQREWLYLNVDAIQSQMPYELLPVFLLQLPEEGRRFDQLPFRGASDAG